MGTITLRLTNYNHLSCISVCGKVQIGVQLGAKKNPFCGLVPKEHAGAFIHNISNLKRSLSYFDILDVHYNVF